MTECASKQLTRPFIVEFILLLSAKSRNVRNNVSAVPIKRYFGFIFQKVPPIWSKSVGSPRFSQYFQSIFLGALKESYCCPIKIMKRFKNDISPDSRYVWYTYEHFLGGKCRIKLKMGNNNHICFVCSHLSKSFYQTAVNPLVKEGL